MRNAIVTGCTMLMSFQIMASGTVLINGNEIKSQAQLHTHLAKELNLSNSYGKNLDSLYEALSTDFSGTTIVKIKHLSTLRAKLGNDYTETLIHTISDASQDNSKVVLVLE